jgi:hypothetical protein
MSCGWFSADEIDDCFWRFPVVPTLRNERLLSARSDSRARRRHRLIVTLNGHCAHPKIRMAREPIAVQRDLFQRILQMIDGL